MSVGERGPVGDHGQTGDTGARGPRGHRGEQYSSWLTRNVVRAYVILLTGVLASISLTAYASRRNNERIERQSVANDRAFCLIVNRTYTEINKNREASRKAYNLLVNPSTHPDSPIIKLRDDLLKTIDGNLPQLDCSAIGRGPDFILQDAIRNHTIPTPPPSVP